MNSMRRNPKNATIDPEAIGTYPQVKLNDSVMTPPSTYPQISPKFVIPIHTPIRIPRLLLPNQLPMEATNPGMPVL